MGYATPKLIGDIFEQRPDYSGIKTFVESGTFQCDSILGVAHIFSDVHTIELSKAFYDEAVEKCKGRPIRLHHGDSATILPALCGEITNPAIFYLDAHWFVQGDEVIPKENPFPLWDEIRAIVSRNLKDIIIVDDVHAFGRTRTANRQLDLCPWREISFESLLDFVGRARVAHWFHHHRGDCMVLYLRPQ